MDIPDLSKNLLFCSSYHHYNQLALISVPSEPGAAACRGQQEKPTRISHWVQRHCLGGQVLFHTTRKNSTSVLGKKMSIKKHQETSGWKTFPKAIVLNRKCYYPDMAFLRNLSRSGKIPWKSKLSKVTEMICLASVRGSVKQQLFHDARLKYVPATPHLDDSETCNARIPTKIHP